MKLCTYLSFDGQTREALEFYAKVLRGKVTAMMKFGETPAAEHVAASARDSIMHGCVEFGNYMLMGTDATPEHPYKGIVGAQVVIALHDVNEAERIFGELSQGGEVTMPLMETFWARRYGMFTDRFGVSWMVNCYPENACV
jgi:PhnB protein